MVGQPVIDAPDVLFLMIEAVYEHVGSPVLNSKTWLNLSGTGVGPMPGTRRRHAKYYGRLKLEDATRY